MIVSRSETPKEMRQVVRIDAHTLHADVSEAAGGKDTAPGPHDYFDASLATCKALTGILYARHKGMALDAIVVEVIRDDSREKQGVYALDVKMAFEGALSDDEKHRLHEVLTRCPIHKLMTTATIEIRQLPLTELPAGAS